VNVCLRLRRESALLLLFLRRRHRGFRGKCKQCSSVKKRRRDEIEIENEDKDEGEAEVTASNESSESSEGNESSESSEGNEDNESSNGFKHDLWISSVSGSICDCRAAQVMTN